METNNQPNPPNNQPDNHVDFFAPKVLWTIIGVLLFVVVVGSIAWYSTIKNTPSSTDQQNQTNLTANWKTYTNSTFGISFMVPPTWSIQEPSATSTGITASNDGVTHTTDASGTYHPTIYIYKQADTYGGSIAAYEKTIHPTLPPLRQPQTILIGGKTAYVYSGNTPPTGQDFRAVFANGNVYTLASNVPILTAEQGAEEGNSLALIFNQILSTFKFTDSSATANWKTYTNTQYGFEFKYPAIWTAQEDSNSVTLLMFGPGEHTPGGGVFSDAARIIFTGANSLTDATKKNIMDWKDPAGMFSEKGFTGVIIYDTKKPEPEWGSWIKAYSISSTGKVVTLDWLSSNPYDTTDFDYKKDLLPILSTFKFTK